MKVSLIVAVGEGGVIGDRGALPWRLPADLARFKRLTMGHHLIVGRRTYEAIGRPLPGREMVVVSRSWVAAGRAVEGVRVVASPEEALAVAEAAGEDEAFVAGGGEIYRHLLPRADRVYLTRVHDHFAGDTTFPELDPARWRLAEATERPADERNPYVTTLQIHERRAGDY